MLPERLSELRLEKKMTHQQMASFLGITRQGYGNYESGKRDLDTQTLNTLADFFEVDTDYLLGRTNVRKATADSGRAYRDGGKGWTEEEIQAADEFIQMLRRRDAEKQKGK